MADYRRMEWQFRANRIAGWVRVAAVLVLAPEVYWAIRYHFPLWDEIALPLTFAIHLLGAFVHRYTRQYRFDLD